MKIIGALIGVCVLLAAGFFAYERYYTDRECTTPLMHLNKAGEDVCVEPSISMVYLTFKHPVRLNFLVNVIHDVPGIDLQNARYSDDRKIFRLVYYMSRTDASRFIGAVADKLNNPYLYEK